MRTSMMFCRSRAPGAQDGWAIESRLGQGVRREVFPSFQEACRRLGDIAAGLRRKGHRGVQ
jgi:hypothetical protein